MELIWLLAIFILFAYTVEASPALAASLLRSLLARC
jgi:hypothetical protein